jgi:hypothetical protein
MFHKVTRRLLGSLEMGRERLQQETWCLYKENVLHWLYFSRISAWLIFYPVPCSFLVGHGYGRKDNSLFLCGASPYSQTGSLLVSGIHSLLSFSLILAASIRGSWRRHALILSLVVWLIWAVKSRNFDFTSGNFEEANHMLLNRYNFNTAWREKIFHSKAKGKNSKFDYELLTTSCGRR